MLELEDVRIAYGKVEAVKGISLSVREGEIVSLVGSNGAGKSTTLRAISGLLRPKSGRLSFQSHDLGRLKPHEVVRLGISHVPEGRRLFPLLTVQENLRMGAYLRCAEATVERAMERVFERFPRLRERRRQLAGTLSGGEQQMLSIGRALISGPTLLMLDEPSFGLAPLIVKEIAEIVHEINQDGRVTVLLVEQNAGMAFSVSSRAYVMENGEIALTGNSQDVAGNPHVREVYLGKPARTEARDAVQGQADARKKTGFDG